MWYNYVSSVARCCGYLVRYAGHALAIGEDVCLLVTGGADAQGVAR